MVIRPLLVSRVAVGAFTPPSTTRKLLLALTAFPTLKAPVPKNAPPLVTIRPLPAFTPPAPIVVAPALVTMAPPVAPRPFTVSTFPVVVPLPMVSAPPDRFQIEATPAALVPTMVMVFEFAVTPAPVAKPRVLAPVVVSEPPLVTVRLL